MKMTGLKELIRSSFYYHNKSLLFGVKWVFKHQDLQMFGLKLKTIWVILAQLKLLVAWHLESGIIFAYVSVEKLILTVNA